MRQASNHVPLVLSQARLFRFLFQWTLSQQEFPVATDQNVRIAFIQEARTAICGSKEGITTLRLASSNLEHQEHLHQPSTGIIK